MGAPGSQRAWRWIAGAGGALALLAGLAVLGIGAFPVGRFKERVAAEISDQVGAPVTIGAIERRPWFSFNPEVAVRGLRIRQPAWAGSGDLLRVDAARVRVPVLDLLRGGKFAPDSIRVSGLEANLIRAKDGRNNWSRNGPDKQGRGGRTGLSDLIVENSRFTYRDDKRELVLAGTIAASGASGLVVDAAGTFKGTPATLTARGAPIVGVDPAAAWPFSATLTAPILKLTAKGNMAGPLNAGAMTLDMAAQAPTLKHLDTIIEAGLFGTQPIDLTATVRRDGSDWFVEKLAGGVGRSRLTGKASVLKRDGRTRIDAAIHASAFDFDSLADDAGIAAAVALRRQVGPRVIPNTRINLSRMGPTDGVIRFAADRLLFRGDSLFRSLSGTLTLDHRDLRITNIRAGMASGRMTGTLRVDSRQTVPVLSTDLHIDGATLEQIIGEPTQVRGPVRGRVRLTGRGDTIRQALAHADGKAAMVATSGSIRKTVAFVLGQDLSGAVGQALGKGEAMVPLRCLVADFRASNGILTPASMTVDTGVSVGKGSGRMVLDGERIALTLSGQTRGRGVLRITDPIHVGGTFTRPSVTVAGIAATEKPKSKVALKILGRSVKSALGLRKDGPQPPHGPAAPVNCNALVAAALR